MPGDDNLMKICVFTDQHLGYRQYSQEEREQDFYDVFNQVVRAMVKEQPDLIINAGDIFHTKNPSPRAINQFQQGLDLIDVPVLSIIGNHTTAKIRNFFPSDKLFDLYFLEDNPFISQDLFIAGVNYRPILEFNDLINKINDLAVQAQNYKKRILVLHQGLEDDFPFGFEIPRGAIDYSKWDIVIVGHIHNRMYRVDPSGCQILYPGSTARSSIAEAQDEMKNGKGYSIVDTDTMKIHNVSLPMPRRFIFIEADQEDLEDEILKIKDSLDGDLLFITMTGENSNYGFDLIDQYNLKGKCLRVDYNFIDINPITIQEEVIQTDDDGNAIIPSAGEILFETVKEKYDEDTANYAVSLMNIFQDGTQEAFEEAKLLSEKFIENQ